MPLIHRIVAARRNVKETFDTLPEAEQDEWREFFYNYAVIMFGFDEETATRIGGGLAQLWSLAHEYCRLYGPMWE